jgi:formylglycine-generating enzyme required for sulfatase activity
VGKAGIEWVRIPGGTFQMGSTNGDSDEKPVHTVRISSFELMKTEVTFGQYNQCVSAGACTPAHTSDGKCSVYDGSKWKDGTLPSSFQGDDQPVVCVDWNQSQAFAKWAGGRLPTEAEWEYAARSGGKAWTYQWDVDGATCGNAVMDDGGDGCGRTRTWPVCSKPAGNSTHGVCDLAGNVWEWTQDSWHDSYSGAPGDGRAWEGGASGRVLRGGGWGFTASYLRASNRFWYDPSSRINYLGFRLAR